MESNTEQITTFTDSIVFDVIKEIAERAEAGLNKYGTTMDRTDLISSDWVQHAYEEALDMAIYLKRLKKDMLAMEEELNAYKNQKSGTKVVYNILPKPNETYTDEEPATKKKYNWHR
jgi:hypothetical protein